MRLIRWNPLRDVTSWHPVTDIAPEFVSMQDEIDRILNQFRGGTVADGESAPWLPSVGIIERENEYRVQVELPGVNKSDVKITLQNDVLTIRGEKKKEQELKGDNYLRTERLYGAFQRSFALPSSVQSDKIEAHYDNGVLMISLPKVEAARPKEVEVKVN
jgi:HSP20 family protein